MRDFFETELGRLHLTTGLQQLSKLSDSEYTELLDILCAECAKFPLIPDKDKQEYIQEFMKTDPEFIGFNKRVIWKWLNVVNRKYITTQADFQEGETVVPPYDEYLVLCALTGTDPVTEAEYDKPVNGDRLGMYGRKIADVQEAVTAPAKEKVNHLRAIKCKHTGLRVPVSDTTEVCNDCGEEFEKAAADSPVEPQKQ